MLIALAAILLLGAILLPQFWVRHVFARHAHERADIPGTGGELARHLIERFKLDGVSVEQTEQGDHYDPAEKAVRLSSDNYAGRSLTAVAVAAHEVSHALQDAYGERSFRVWQQLASLARVTDRMAGVFFIAAPFLAILARTPLALVALIGAGIALLSVRVIVTLVSLPLEFDASFSKALPILRQGSYVADNDMPAVRSILRAAAFTYLAASLMSLVNLARWVRMLR